MMYCWKSTESVERAEINSDDNAIERTPIWLYNQGNTHSPYVGYLEKDKLTLPYSKSELNTGQVSGDAFLSYSINLK